MTESFGYTPSEYGALVTGGGLEQSTDVTQAAGDGSKRVPRLTIGRRPAIPPPTPGVPRVWITDDDIAAVGERKPLPPPRPGIPRVYASPGQLSWRVGERKPLPPPRPGIPRVEGMVIRKPRVGEASSQLPLPERLGYPPADYGALVTSGGLEQSTDVTQAAVSGGKQIPRRVIGRG